MIRIMDDGMETTLGAGKRRWVVTLTIVLLPIVVLAGAWRLGGVSALEDDLIYYLPVRAYIGERIASGDFPLWNPLVGMGASIAADPQSGLWYPATYLFAILPPLSAYPTTLVLHFILAGAGMYRLLRSYRHDWRAALLGAIAFELCGYLVAHRAHLTIHHATAWVPWVLLGWRCFAQSGKYRHFALAVSALGLQLLVQHVQVSIITCTLLTAYVIFVLWPMRRSLWWQYPAGIILGAAISAVQLIPTYFHFAGSARGTAAWYVFIENSWWPTSKVLMAFPMIFGTGTPNFYDVPWWGLSYFSEQSAYLSLVISILAIATLGLVGRNREVIFWWAACMVALVIALGDFTPVSKWLFHIPVYRNLRVPARWILVWMVALPILASIGAHTLMRGSDDLRHRMRRSIPIAIAWVTTFMLLCLAVFVILRLNVDTLREQYAGRYYTDRLIDGLVATLRWNNPAIWLPIGLLALTGSLLTGWTRTRRPSFFWAILAVAIIDLASVAAFVDVDTHTYDRQDLHQTPALAEAINKHSPQPGDRLLVPRFAANYDPPLEVLWPETNMQHGIATFNAYGPFMPNAHRMLFRFMPWGSSEEILTLLRRPDLMRSMGIRFVAVRTNEERSLLEAAMLLDAEPQVKPIPGTDARMPVIAGQDLLWPIRIETPGLYELTLDADPVPGSASRWFVRLETQEGEEIGRTRSLEPADLATGPRRMRFTFDCNTTTGDAYVRIKSERDHAIWAANGTFACVAVVEPHRNEPIFVHLEDLPGGVSLYELPGTAPLVRRITDVRCVDTLTTAVEWLQTEPTEPAGAILQAACQDLTIADGTVDWQRPEPEEIRVQASAGVILINESNDPGWHATIDGKPTEIIPANAVAQAIRVPGNGTHDIRLIYRPPGLTAGLILSAGGILVILTGLIRTRRQHPA